VYWVYILASSRNGTLYVGITNDLARRIHEHRAGIADSFTRRYGVHRLVHMEAFGSLMQAREREARLKRWRRAWKIELIERGNPEWRDLYFELN
jgi:putative endonuclease